MAHDSLLFVKNQEKIPVNQGRIVLLFCNVFLHHHFYKYDQLVFVALPFYSTKNVDLNESSGK